MVPGAPRDGRETAKERGLPRREHICRVECGNQGASHVPSEGRPGTRRKTQVISRREIHAPRRAPADRPLSLVIDDGLLRAPDAKSRRASAKTEIDVLERKEVVGVENADA